MTFEEFLIKYNGEWVEESGTTARNQCVDLANRYIREVLGLPIIEWTNARDFPSRAGDKYDYILNTPEGIPQEGDLVIWGGTVWGHIAIFIEGNADTFRSFDQNYPTGSHCHVQNHNYTNPPVLGWLRAKKPTDQQALINQLREDRDTNWNLYLEEQKAKILLEDSIAQKNKVISTLTTENQKLVTSLEIAELDKAKAEGDLAVLKTEHDNTTTALKDLTVKLDVCEGLLANRKDLKKYETKEIVAELINRFLRR